jgi:hypothetical protein
MEGKRRLREGRRRDRVRAAPRAIAVLSSEGVEESPDTIGKRAS